MSDLTDRAERLLAEITPGPWTVIGGGEYISGPGIPIALDDGGVNATDAEFIAAAPQLVADLIAEVRRLTPREITSVEEVRAMPVGSIILDAEHIVMERVAEILGDCWVMTEETGRVGHVYVELPARILYVPEVRP